MGPLLLLLLVELCTRSKPAIGLTAACVAIGMAELVRAVIYEPFADVDCEKLCRHNPALVTSDLSLADTLGRLAAAATVGVAVIAGAAAIRAWRRTRRDASLARPALLASAAAAVIVGAVGAVRVASDTVPAPGSTKVAVLVVTSSVSVLLAAALVMSALDPLRARRDVARVARLLTRTESEDDVQTVFRRAFGDPALRVGYWADGVGYIDEHGEIVEATSDDSRIELQSHGEPLAIIVHSRGAVSADLVSRQLGSQAMLSIHNESLMFELEREIAEVERSRRRIVEVGDAERRRLERDLHDGAQQRLLALSFELRRGERAALVTGDTCSALEFGRANTLARTALEQLRNLAHDIHPVILHGGGLRDAMLDFAAESKRPITIDVQLSDRIPGTVESAAYGVLIATITEVRGAAIPEILVTGDGERLSLTIDHVSEFPQHAVDRTEAAGGAWAATADGFEVALPCVS